MRINNKGVTMMLLAVTIVLMIIIAYLAVYYSENVAPEARLASAYASLKAVKESCEQKELLFTSEKDEYYYFGKSMHTQLTTQEFSDYSQRCGIYDTDTLYGDRVYLINPFSNSEDDKRRIKNLELSNLNCEVVVDLDNDKYYLVDGISRVDWGYTGYEFAEIQSMYTMINSYGGAGNASDLNNIDEWHRTLETK